MGKKLWKILLGIIILFALFFLLVLVTAWM